MKTLTEIKNEVAQDHGWDRYSQIKQAFRGGVISENSFNDFLTDVCKDYAQSVAEDLRERIIQNAVSITDPHFGQVMVVDIESIRNVETILK